MIWGTGEDDKDPVLHQSSLHWIDSELRVRGSGSVY